MDVRLSAEQHALRDSAAQVVDRLGPQAVGQLDDGERAAKLDAAVAAAGWRELRTATDDGAPWTSGVEVGLVAEELARGLADTAFLGPTLAAELRRLAGAPPAPAPETVLFLPDLSRPVHASDPAPEAVAGTSPSGARTDPSAAAAPGGTAGTAGAGGTGGWALPAGAVAIDAAGATSALVLLATRHGTRLGTVALKPAEVRVDLTRPVATPDPAASVEPVPDQARALTDGTLTRWTALGLAVTCADLVGSMRGAATLATGYATERRQYGKAIGSFQAVQHMLADAHVSTEGSRSAALHAAWAADALPPNEALAAAALAKAYCARAARDVCETATQVHGGIGNTWECLAHVHLRRALLASDVLGGVGPSLARVLEHHGIETGGGRGLR